MSTNEQTPTPATPFDGEIAAAIRTQNAYGLQTYEGRRDGYLRALADLAPRLAAADALARAARSAYDMLRSEAHDQRLQLPVTNDLGYALTAYKASKVQS